MRNDVLEFIEGLAIGLLILLLMGVCGGIERGFIL